MNNKKGSIEIFILTITLMMMFIILTIIFLLYVQINSCVFNVKSDLFYIAQNAYLAVDYKELAYSDYEINEPMLKEKIILLLHLNYPNYNFHINEIKYEHVSKSVLIDINLLIQPIVLNNLIKIFSLNIKENVKLKLMEVK
ncbi:MAG: hypothetical protein PHD15_05490 [Clostridia bacterium]|nr:hypothetical protein [Clostridia bacterium]MDD4387186.1 hypothetical protein [Clostridia bacterium]